MDLLKTDATIFYLNIKTQLTSRIFIFFGSLIALWVAQYKMRLPMSPYIIKMRSILSSDYSMFASHLFPQSFSVFLISAILLCIFIKAKIVPAPRFLGPLNQSLKEGFFWGSLSCVPVVPLALNMGYKIGFNLDVQRILGNIVSNSYEEIVFRVFLFLVAMYLFKSRWVSLIFTSLIFGLVHDQYPISMQVLVVLAGIFFSFAYIRSNSVLAAIIAHQVSDMILDTILVH